jgi:hypothetical protein
MKKKKKSKSESQRIHAKRRFLERHGINFTRHLRREFVKLIQTHQCHFVERQSHRVTVWDLIHEGEVYRVVYDSRTSNIVTVYPKETPR